LVEPHQDDDLVSYLGSKGIPASNQHPPMMADPSLLEKLKDLPPMYVFASAAVPVLVSALRAYAITHKKKLILKQGASGTEIDLTNYSVDEIKELSVLDVFDFEE
jgi:hypothetical protein